MVHCNNCRNLAIKTLSNIVRSVAFDCGSRGPCTPYLLVFSEMTPVHIAPLAVSSYLFLFFIHNLFHKKWQTCFCLQKTWVCLGQRRRHGKSGQPAAGLHVCVSLSHYSLCLPLLVLPYPADFQQDSSFFLASSYSRLLPVSREVSVCSFCVSVKHFSCQKVAVGHLVGCQVRWVHHRRCLAL